MSKVNKKTYNDVVTHIQHLNQWDGRSEYSKGFIGALEHSINKKDGTVLSTVKIKEKMLNVSVLMARGRMAKDSYNSDKTAGIIMGYAWVLGLSG